MSRNYSERAFLHAPVPLGTVFLKGGLPTTCGEEDLGRRDTNTRGYGSGLD